MKKLTLLLAFIGTLTLSAQTTYDLDWAIGINGEAASLTIEVGDTVRWTWTDTLPHTVTSEAGSQETFDSGTITGNGQQYSYTFTQEGINDYLCIFHPATMFGTITVEAELSAEDKFFKNIKLYPNPVKDRIILTSMLELDSFKLYNSLGSLVYQNTKSGHTIDYDMSHLQSGIYFVVVSSNGLNKTFKIVKK